MPGIGIPYNQHSFLTTQAFASTSLRPLPFRSCDELDFEPGLGPIPAPDWLTATLEFGSATAARLTGRKIAFHFEDFGWAVAIVGKPNTDPGNCKKRGRSKASS